MGVAPIWLRRPMTPFSLLLASLLAAIIMFGGSVLIAMVLLERPLRKKFAARRSADQAGPKGYGRQGARDRAIHL